MGQLRHYEAAKTMEKVVPISTTIPQALYLEIKESGWKFNELLILGANAKKNFPNQQERVTKLEEAIEVYKTAIMRLRDRVATLEFPDLHKKESQNE